MSTARAERAESRFEDWRGASWVCAFVFRLGRLPERMREALHGSSLIGSAGSRVHAKTKEREVSLGPTRGEEGGLGGGVVSSSCVVAAAPTQTSTPAGKRGHLKTCRRFSAIPAPPSAPPPPPPLSRGTPCAPPPRRPRSVWGTNRRRASRARRRRKKISLKKTHL